mgnify:CR=1 FL=1
MMAARADHEEVMRALVAAGADPTLKAQDGSSVLMAAASGARLKTFAYAFAIDPHVDVVTTTGNTVMHASIAMNDRTQPEVCEVIQFLADHGAKLDELNGAGRTPISMRRHAAGGSRGRFADQADHRARGQTENPPNAEPC